MLPEQEGEATGGEEERQEQTEHQLVQDPEVLQRSQIRVDGHGFVPSSSHSSQCFHVVGEGIRLG